MFLNYFANAFLALSTNFISPASFVKSEKYLAKIVSAVFELVNFPSSEDVTSQVLAVNAL